MLNLSPHLSKSVVVGHLEVLKSFEKLDLISLLLHHITLSLHVWLCVFLCVITYNHQIVALLLFLRISPSTYIWHFIEMPLAGWWNQMFDNSTFRKTNKYKLTKACKYAFTKTFRLSCKTSLLFFATIHMHGKLQK